MRFGMVGNRPLTLQGMRGWPGPIHLAPAPFKERFFEVSLTNRVNGIFSEVFCRYAAIRT